MEHQRKLWPLFGITTILIFSLPTVGFGQNHETTSIAPRGDRVGSRSYTHQVRDFSANEFFTQADRDLINRVEANIADDPRTAGSVKHITIGARQGIVALGGSVPSEKEHSQLVNDVQKTLGVVRVQDNLRIAGVAGIEPRDRMSETAAETRSTVAPVPQTTRMERRAEATSARRGSFPATEPETERMTGADEPSLTGSGEMDEEDRTGTTGPSGTRSTSPLNTGAVDTMGRVTKSAGDEAVTENDRALVAQARTALAGNPTINNAESAVHLKADNGVIYLSGWTANEQERTAMVDTVRSLTGVQGVVNQLRIRPGAVGAAK